MLSLFSGGVVSVVIRGTKSYVKYSVKDINISYKNIKNRPSSPITFEDYNGNDVTSYE